MSKIIVDSSCDLSADMKKNLDASVIPFKITIDSKEYIDDENLDVMQMIEAMKNSSKGVKTACPAPGDFYEEFEKHDDIYVVTISDKLSGSYNSASIAKDMILEKHPDKKIHIFDSKSASAGTTLVTLKLKEEIDKGTSRENLIKNINEFISKHNIYFILESLNNLIKNGRISKTKGLIASVLSFRPIMKGKKGSIELVEKVRGNRKSFNRMIEMIGENVPTGRGQRVQISHVDALERANKIKAEIEKRYEFDEVNVVQTTGLCSAYADYGGIVLAYL